MYFKHWVKQRPVGEDCIDVESDESWNNRRKGVPLIETIRPDGPQQPWDGPRAAAAPPPPVPPMPLMPLPPPLPLNEAHCRRSADAVQASVEAERARSRVHGLTLDRFGPTTTCLRWC